MKLPTNGFRRGTLLGRNDYVGNRSALWTNVPSTYIGSFDSYSAMAFDIYDDTINFYHVDRKDGRAVRCIKDGED